MAEHVERERIEEMEIVPYSDLRSKIQSGSLFFASGDYLVSQAIRKFTSSPWSHVGIIFRANDLDRVLLLESVEDVGVRFAPLSKYLTDYEDGKPYKGRIVLARCDNVDGDCLKTVAQVGIDELTRPYDKDEIAKIMARIALGRGKWKRDREYICSELVYECFSKAGREFAHNRKGFISPEDVWRDEKIIAGERIL